MPINLDALIRYHTIDHCLQRKFKEWTISSLGLACFDAIEQVKPIKGKSTISNRTIEDDIRIMRSEILGYNAPIEIKNSIVRYTDKNYSIKNCSLNKDDLENLILIAQVLRMYNGFKLNTHIDNILKKLETQSYLSHFKKIDNVVQIESPPVTQGFEYLDFILKSILENQVIKFEYKKFQNNISETHVIHPYLLKEFRGRWYLLGYHETKLMIKTYALDRILNIVIENINFIKNTFININTFFNHTIGVSFPEKLPEKIQLHFHAGQLNYVLSQPIHNSQVIIEQTDESLTIEVTLIINNELIMTLLGQYGGIQVLSPPHLREKMKKTIELQLKNYQ